MDQFVDQLKSQFPSSSINQQGFWQVGGDSAELTGKIKLTVLTQYQLLSVIGPDSSKFLQGQTTCDWREVNLQTARYGSYCNIKGRMIGSFLGFSPAEDNIQLRMRSDIIESSKTTLAKYIVFSKAKLSVNSHNLVGFGISGENCSEALKSLLQEHPEAALSSNTAEQITVIKLPGIEERFECWVAPEKANAIWTALTQQAEIVSSDHWELGNIQAGIGEVCAATQDLFIPQMLNHQLIGAVSFKKGCYTGQEIVARMQYRGKLKRHMYLAEKAGALPKPGDDVFVDENSQSIGNIVSAVNSGEGVTLLAVLTSDAVAQGNIHLANDSNTLNVGSLPYALEVED
ncbi:folate-binding protein YgfZ [Spongiibacter sp. KMU-158]|uniref:Folate-binding protein YgfZ n=1 Tax=Spongiibacter pelagi TaxID=2760804 RepID=A0A927BZQ0_9GAMM|nr:folate-binding protein YgfZ [Spongiibacter pelagi]MBD2858569.1 folate-binding protein YgfZ [Spongiibacter pelagi]